MSDQPQHEPPETKGQPFVAHLIELRDRVLRSLLVIGLLFAMMFPFGNLIYEFVSAPLRALLPANSSMIATQVMSPFLTPFKLSLVAALFASMPFTLYQVWAFVAPGLYRRERHIVIPLFVSSVALFYAGMAFAYYVVFPIIFGFFTSVAPSGVTVMTDISQYLDFVLTLFFAFGVAFEIPVATVILIWMGVVSAATLAEKRPYVIVGCFVVGMVLTPPDVFSQTMLAVPMWLLFEAGLFCGRRIKRDAPAEASGEDLSPPVN